jgi:hypothetical protein
MKIALYTHHQDYNYGAMLQAYATQEILRSFGHEVEFAFVRTVEHEKANEWKKTPQNLKDVAKLVRVLLSPKAKKRFVNFRNFHANLSLGKRYLHVKDLKNDPPKCDVHLVGSDQVWYLAKGLPENNYFFLDFLPVDSCKISFASSLGSSFIDPSAASIVKHHLSSFYAISTRELEGAQIISQLTGRQVKDVLDPTLHLSADKWAQIGNERIMPERYMLCYGFDKSTRSRDMLAAMRKKSDLPVVLISNGLYCHHEVDYFISDAGPAEFVGLIKNADFVFSASYHGIAFAIIFQKSFLGPVHPSRNMRMSSMLKKLGLEGRQVQNVKDISSFPEGEILIDYSNHEDRINSCIQDSKDWLATSLNGASGRTV